MFIINPQQAREKAMQNPTLYKRKPKSIPFNLQVVVYHFEIIRQEIFTSYNKQQFLKYVFKLTNENEEYEEDQMFLLNDEGHIHSSFYDFIDQFRQFGEVNDDFNVEDLVSEKGTCYFETNHSRGKTYKKIVLTSWGGNENE